MREQQRFINYRRVTPRWGDVLMRDSRSVKEKEDETKAKWMSELLLVRGSGGGMGERIWDENRKPE